MAGKIYYCVCEDWSERITVNSFGGKNRVEEQRYATSCFKTCHSIHDDHDKAQRKAADIRQSIARNRAAQAPIVVIDPEQTMTAEEIKAAIKTGMDAERNAQK